MDVCVIGTGYVGLVTSACFAQMGHHVLCVDHTQNAEHVAQMQAGKLPVDEPGLDDMVQNGLQAGRLYFTSDIGAGVAYGDVICIAVSQDTLALPKRKDEAIAEVAQCIGTHLSQMKRAYKVVVNRLPAFNEPGNRLRRLILDEMSRQHIKQSSPQEFVMLVENFDVVNNPAFLRKGTAVGDMVNPNKIILGSNSKRAIEIVRSLYDPLINHQVINHQILDQSRESPVPVYITNLALSDIEQPHPTRPSLHVA